MRKDQNSHRFLWRDLSINDVPKTYCMTRVTFGNTSSPFLSIGTVQKHAKINEDIYPKATEEILENMYVDDLLSGSHDDQSTIQLQEELLKLMHSGGFHLTKWASNSKTVMECFPLEDRAPNFLITPNTYDSEKLSDLLKALGISWNTVKDVFFYQAGSAIANEPDPMTKRSLISLYARLFDPMGFVSPFLMRPKLLFQELWARGKDWDDPLDDDIAKEWNDWKHELSELENVEIPRCLLPKENDVKKIELHGFGDAKLLAAYVTAKLIDYVIKALRIPVHEVYAWSDSQVVLSWIRKSSNNWKVFVANRVQDIQQRVEPERWHYCTGNENPADLVSRGISIQDLLTNELWWHGPSWLQQDTINWPQKSSSDENPNECFSEAKTKANAITCNVRIQEIASYPEIAAKYESWKRLIRITAWIMKWSLEVGEKSREY
ncbi:uncharacterized protein LOC114538100 [Dendronephthya gigantea]|uniref:uncharacterized protein LOC114538100 n=1 Tax=Dendronephthya gigantea TaxID=151771 RepID=UPI00106B5C79|nr:uncharacterized protein LOC114538100 [Dendronephthya gigantea]